MNKEHETKMMGSVLNYGFRLNTKFLPEETTMRSILEESGDRRSSGSMDSKLVEMASPKSAESSSDGVISRLDLELSRACNFKCMYCYAGATASKDELSVDEIKDVVSEAKDLGAKTVVNIGGGETLMYRNINDVLQHEKNLGMKSVVITNGSFITKEGAKNLYQNNHDIVLKYNSDNRDIKNKLVGNENGSNYSKLALQNLLNAGYTGTDDGPSLSLETVITKDNIDEISAMYALCREYGINPFVEKMTRQGLARGNWDELSVPEKDITNLFEELREYDSETWGVEWPNGSTSIAGHKCELGEFAYVKSNGSVLVCPAIDYESDETNYKKVKEAGCKTPLREIIASSDTFKWARDIDTSETRCGGNCPGKDYQEKMV